VLPPTQEGIVYADIDLGGIEVANHFFDPVGHYARPDVFQVRIDRTRRPAFVDVVDSETRDYPPLEDVDAVS